MNDAEPKPPAPPDNFDEPPLEVADHPQAAAEWRRLAPMLRKTRQITDADRSALMALCLEWGRYLEARTHVKTLVVLTVNGFPMPNPYLAVMTKALSACLKLWPELGLTPSSRSRVKVADVPPDDPFAEFDAPPKRDEDRTH